MKTAAQALSIDVWQPRSLRSQEAIDRLEATNPDIFIVVAFGEIFRGSVLSLPAHGCLNIHPSLLPRYRGSSPIPAAILNGDRETGVSLIEMVKKLDAGPIVAQRELILTGRESGVQLSQVLADLAAEMLPDVMESWVAGELSSVPQDDEEATYTRELTKADGNVDWTKPAVEIERQVRAYSPWPSSWSSFDGRRLVIHSSEVWPELHGAEPGSVFMDNRHVLVACGQESLCLIEVQPEGKKSMPADAWFRGLRTEGTPRFDVVA